MSTSMPQLFPFISLVMAVVFLMVAKIARIDVRIVFFLTTLFLASAWLLGYGDVSGYNLQPIFGFAMDKLGALGLKLLIPAVFAILVLVLRIDAKPEKKIETFLLILISCFGGMVTLISQNWMLFFIGVQCLSLPLYGLIAFDTKEARALSSSVRYLLLSFVAMAIMLFGILLLYAATGTMDLAAQGASFAKLAETQAAIAGLGFALILVGLGFKASLFPFHAWAPEVYQGTRLFVVSYLVVVVKSIVVLFLIRSAWSIVGGNDQLVASIISFMAIVSMWVGNGMMLREQSMVRIIAFLSIGHLGALMIPVLAKSSVALEAVFLDIIAFGIAMLLIFAVLKGIGANDERKITIDNMRGLFHRHPRASIALAIALISLTGFPLTAGFIGKVAIFRAGVDAALWQLVGNFVATTVLSLAVIAKIVASMWQRVDSVAMTRIPSPRWSSEILICASFLIMAMGIFPEPWIAWVKSYTMFALGL